MFTLIRGGSIFAPEPLGVQDVLLAGARIAQIGHINAAVLEQTGLPLTDIDARECLVTPGIIDPHEHLLGGSGEEGFATQTPEIALSEIVTSGITTAVGCLGVDTTTKTLPGLLAKVKAYNAEGITAFLYSGGYNVPPVTLTGSVREDMLFILEVIGAGEIAIADERSTEPSVAELARLVRDAYVGGLLSGKSGVTHFHVGSGRERLRQLRALLDDYDIAPESLYPTHVERNEELMQEAVDLSRRGVTVDVDTVEHDLSRWVSFFLQRGGDPSRLTASSDAAINSPGTLLEQVRDCVLHGSIGLETILPIVTVNTARVLKLQRKGRLAVGCDADVLVLRRDSLAVAEVIAMGRPFVSGGNPVFRERFLEKSNRRIELHGGKA
jgi:beta-aspartyl-dipeptidase (metallo-type)